MEWYNIVIYTVLGLFLLAHLFAVFFVFGKTYMLKPRYLLILLFMIIVIPVFYILLCFIYLEADNERIMLVREVEHFKNPQNR